MHAKTCRTITASAAATLALLGASVEAAPDALGFSDNVIRLGLMNDQSGVLSSDLGPGAVIAARLAIEDMGGKIDGKPIELMVADDQNKPEVGVGIARKWLEQERVDAIVGGSISSIALAVQGLARDNKKPYLISGSGSVDLTGKSCSPMTFQFTFDSYALTRVGAESLIKRGYKTWYFVTMDSTFGSQVQGEATRLVEQAGGKVLGSVRHPIGTSDFSSYVLQAQASNAQVVVFVNTGGDFVNSMKQAREYRLNSNGRVITAIGVTTNMVQAVGLDAMQGMQFADPMYWDKNAETRAWSERYMARSGGKPPGFSHAGTYSAVLHYLKAVKETGTDDGVTVAAKMKATPVNDFSMKNVAIREDGQVMRPMNVVQVKTPAESRSRYDLYKIVSEIPAVNVWRSLDQGGCPYVSKSVATK